MIAPGRGGVSVTVEAAPMFAPASEQLLGNNLPPWTGSHSGPPFRPGPGPSQGGQLGEYDGITGADPSRPDQSPFPWSSWTGASGESDRGDPPGKAGPGLGYGEGADNVAEDNLSPNSFAGRLNAPNREQITQFGRPSYWRGGIQGFNDQQQVRDRHAYFDGGHQRTGLQPSPPGTPPNYHTDGPARPDLRTVNRSVNPQIGSDNSRNQDDLHRPYTWLGQQDGTNSPVYGGVPGMWVPYGTRGGIPYEIRSPVEEGSPLDGPAMVWSGPPHGLHSDTIQGGTLILKRYLNTPQMRPVRFDRPSNSPIAGQSYSQTLPMQGQPGAGHSPRKVPGAGLSFHVGGRGWLGG